MNPSCVHEDYRNASIASFFLLNCNKTIVINQRELSMRNIPEMFTRVVYFLFIFYFFSRFAIVATSMKFIILQVIAGESFTSFSLMQIRSRCSKILLLPAYRAYLTFHEFSSKFVFASCSELFILSAKRSRAILTRLLHSTRLLFNVIPFVPGKRAITIAIKCSLAPFRGNDSSSKWNSNDWQFSSEKVTRITCSNREK